MLKVAVAVDCDPDRDSDFLNWEGVYALPRLFDIPDVKWTFDVRCDTHVQDQGIQAIMNTNLPEQSEN